MSNKIDWLVESFRITAFTTNPLAELDYDWWKIITEEQPNTKTIDNKENSLIEEGIYNDNNLKLTVKRERLDWNIIPILNVSDLPGFSNIGLLSDTIGIVKKIFDDWTTKCDVPELKRIAFGAILLFPVDSREDGYKILNFLLNKIDLDHRDTSDFLYQINWKIDAKTDIDELRINQLTKWSTAVAKFLKLPSADEVVELYACRLELDMNNIKLEERSIPKDKLIPLFDELINLGINISVKGDKK